MKKISFLLLMALCFGACQNKDTKTTDAETADTTKYPYTFKKVQGWKINNDHKNGLTALSIIKSFENMDTATMGKLLADSVWFNLDGYKFKGTRIQFLNQIQGEFAKMSSFKIDMEDMASVINKDKSEEWVSLWYKQVTSTKDGKIDTIQLYNDFKIKDGKVQGLSEYIQHPMK
ncbi:MULTISPECIES: hypothetical protein [Pedobacter]|uniref:hypothetical protein n=1 Tax=Pedobacter TaxID=84567 RepID=UPI00121AC3A0|nr:MULTISPECIES: hypothetical protein [Pedobacter]RZL62997.1 MAG: hypothetical protein EOO93_08170 [Pedobacter sp.]